jgi:hypothetical protein
MNITTKFSTLKLLSFSFSSCLTIERSIVFKTMDRQCESFFEISEIFIFFWNFWNFQNFMKILKFWNIFFLILEFRIFFLILNFYPILWKVVTMYIYVEVYFLKRIKLLWMTGGIAYKCPWDNIQIHNAKYCQKMRDCIGLYHFEVIIQLRV